MAEKTAKEKTKPVINRLVMINLHISYESGRRTMKNLSKKTASDHDANAKMINTTIRLIPADKITSFTTALSQARSYYIANSLPWEDGNWRVVPVTKVQQFRDDLETLISKAKDEFDRCFLGNYDQLKENADKGKGKIKGCDFPTKQELEDGFKIEYNMGQIASISDCRIEGIDRAMRTQIKKETEERYVQQVDKGLRGLAENLKEQVELIADRVSDDDQKGKKYTRILTNLTAMAESAEALNVTGNKVLEEQCVNIKTKIANWSPEAIKTSPEVRESIKKEASSVSDELAGVSLDAE